MTELDRAAVVQQMRAVEERVAARWRSAGGQPAVEVLRELVSKERADGAEEVELKFSVTDPELQRLFLVLCRRYGLTAFRMPGQRKTTFQAEGPQRFMNELWTPLFGGCANALRARVSAWMQSVIEEFDAAGAPAGKGA